MVLSLIKEESKKLLDICYQKKVDRCFFFYYNIFAFKEWRDIMAVKIRLTRMGAKKKPTYRIVATDSRRPRDGQYIELIGTYAPVGECKVNINEEVALKWLNNGAIPTDTVKSLFTKAGIMKKFTESKEKKDK